MADSPSTLPTARTSGDTAEIVALLRENVAGPVDADRRRRAEYSTDASNYRVVPDVVVFPLDTDDVLAIADVSRRTSTPLTMRGGGTSVAGNSIGPGIVVDLSRSVNRVIEIDPEARTARVEPGLVLGALQKKAAVHGLRFGPDPSTWARCTIGGMIGNNACGSHSLVFGRTADNVVDLDVLDGRGRRFTAGSGLDGVPGLEDFAQGKLELFRTELGRFGRQVSGYSLEHLLPEKGRNLAAALVGTEGTCGVVLGATVTLVDVPVEPILLVLGYPSMFAAADAVPAILTHHPGAIEGLDARLVDVVRRMRGDAAVSDLPSGAGWLLVELSGSDRRETLDRADKLTRDASAISARVITSAAAAKSVWRIREDGAGLGGRTAAGNQTWPGFEDAAVPPENLGGYLRDFDAMLNEYGIEGAPYGHFGDGCIHIRLDIPLDHDGDVLRSMMQDAARLVARHGGSLSGEHGDGRARSELLPLMYSREAIASFAAFKHIFDPQNLLNPGVVVQPAPLDRDLRRPAALPLLSVNGLAFTHDDGDFTKAVHRCVGVGKCRADNTATGGFMCPSFIATNDEKDSTRGRARVLQEMANGTLVDRDWRAPEVHDALDLCLSCKACSSDCPAGVDMAAYKTEMLHQTYKGRLRPITHYVLGWLPRWARLVSPLSRLINPVLSLRWIEKLVLTLGGMDSRRSIPAFAATSFTASQRKSPAGSPAPRGDKQVLLWVDSFSDNFSPTIAHSAIAVLEAAGYSVVTPERPACCGLTWITTGQLTGARRILGKLMDDFYPLVAEGIPVLGLEPSCTAVLRSDLLELFPDDPRAQAIAQNTYTLAELLSAPTPVGPASTWSPPRLDGCDVVVQPHCHHHSVMGFSPDARLLEELGASVTPLAGCCGLAGNFGMEKGHFDVSVAVAENAMLPALRAAAPGAILLADGFSCRTQASQLAEVDGIHLAELLAARLIATAPATTTI
ncbi:FAD-binding and (Fe-S)-binding domain-containing protein [Cryobacterium sp. PH29-G1]|uniref:FAD-binding and (Fe-S)-binding domain-containing protein n=1 Tax=Cryobacterium sp. PH29-G1 TaxID=3046211 RepID=UPI0024BBA251|nr:FAD-binding and (Fe-S)-binding domain-containing protein [Cryobacterium sp. PH29-G1]MDJ0348848.1 FAD-binding and (Fe-S)-binding domain-containing protein [Cryobacterium sp. PH29-G1]